MKESETAFTNQESYTGLALEYIKNYDNFIII